MVLKCLLIIELIGWKKMEKGEKNHHFWAFSRGGTGTKHNGIGTKHSGTDTISVLSTGTGTQCSILDQRSYFCHNLVIYYPI